MTDWDDLSKVLPEGVEVTPEAVASYIRDLQKAHQLGHPLADMRIPRRDEIGSIKHVLTELIYGWDDDRVLIYAVGFRGAMVTALGIRKSETEVTPRIIVLHNDDWGEVPHLTDEHGPTRDWLAN